MYHSGILQNSQPLGKSHGIFRSLQLYSALWLLLFWIWRLYCFEAFSVHCPSSWQQSLGSTKYFQICMPLQLFFFFSVRFDLLTASDKQALHLLCFSFDWQKLFRLLLAKLKLSNCCWTNIKHQKLGLRLLMGVSSLVPNPDRTVLSHLWDNPYVCKTGFS